jgi:uncharacterized membrane protein YdjX (TVP38/TMEM64 family)
MDQYITNSVSSYGFFVTTTFETNNNFNKFLVYLGAITSQVLFLVYGIMALIPTGPFDHQNISLGVTLIVLATVGIAAACGSIVGMIIGTIIYLPFKQNNLDNLDNLV